MIQIPLEIGDIILSGRFKNKKITVKEIGVDDYGLPTVNGRGIMKIRIQKLIKPKVEENIVKGRLKENDVAFDIGPTKPCRIKKEDGKYWIYRVNNRDNSEVCASNVGYESKESAERGAQLKGYVMVDAKGNVQEYEFAKVSKNADARSADYKPKQTKIEYIEEIVRKVVTESKSLVDTLKNADLYGWDTVAKLADKTGYNLLSFRKGSPPNGGSPTVDAIKYLPRINSDVKVENAFEDKEGNIAIKTNTYYLKLWKGNYGGSKQVNAESKVNIKENQRFSSKKKTK